MSVLLLAPLSLKNMHRKIKLFPELDHKTALLLFPESSWLLLSPSLTSLPTKESKRREVYNIKGAYLRPHRQPQLLRLPHNHRSLHTDSQSAYLRNPEKATSVFFEGKNFLFDESHLTFDIVHTKVPSRSVPKSWVCGGSSPGVPKRPSKKKEDNNNCTGLWELKRKNWEGGCWWKRKRNVRRTYKQRLLHSVPIHRRRHAFHVQAHFPHLVSVLLHNNSLFLLFESHPTKFIWKYASEN